MHDIHTLYRIAYEASLQTQLISLQARLRATKVFTQNHVMFSEGLLLSKQIEALQAEVDRLNK